jgi:pimeloyl-ACP methyl ester carboxylesterase
LSLKSATLNFRNSSLYCELYGSDIDTIILHGAGQSSLERFSRMQKALFSSGVSTVSFDFIGHGRTGGDLFETSLKSRTDQALHVIKQFCLKPVTIIAASMGAYTAVKLTELIEINNLILLVPAAYTPDAYFTDFGPQFSKIIRAENSWNTSDAFSILKKFTGNLLIVAAEHDEVIPQKLSDQLHRSAICARSNQYHIIPGSYHRNLFPGEADFRSTIQKIVSLIKGDENH